MVVISKEKSKELVSDKLSERMVIMYKCKSIQSGNNNFRIMVRGSSYDYGFRLLGPMHTQSKLTYVRSSLIECAEACMETGREVHAFYDFNTAAKAIADGIVK